MRIFNQTILAAIFIGMPILGTTVPAQDAATNVASDFAPGDGIRLDFRDAQLDDVLSYLSRAAGFTIYFRPGVRVEGMISVRSEQPLSRNEAVNLLKTVLSDHGVSVLQNERTLTLLNTADVHTETAIKLGANPALIPKDAEVVTQIIPLRNLNPVELAKILPSLLPQGAILNVDESANSLLLTDTQANVHRAAEIIAALDSVSATASTLRVFPLQYADAKSVADMVKELFSPADASRATGNNNPGGAFIRFPGGFRGGGGAPGAAAPAPAGGQTPVSRVAAVADEHGNAVIVSAPESLLPVIAQLVTNIDVPVEDITTIQVFPLTNADPGDMANELATLFPNDTSSSDASGQQVQFDGQGGRGGQAVGARQGPVDNADSPGSRTQKLGRVLAVPDPRTSSLLVAAAKSLMPEIAAVVTRLDAQAGGRQELHVMTLRFAEGADVQRILQEIFPAGNTTAASTSVTDPLSLRSITMWNNQFTSGAGSGISTGSPGSSSAGRGGTAP
jgi:type II secretory pathway component GspD/PulD (secretin)